MDLGDRIEEFSAERKISFDGECYHIRLPLELIETIKKKKIKPSKVHWEFSWWDGTSLHVVLTFGQKKDNDIENQTNDNDSDGDYVVLKE